MSRKEYIWFSLVLVVDQISKILFFKQLNDGGVFGVGKGWAWEIFALTALVAVGLMLKNSVNRLERFGLVMITSAGISNLIDRLFLAGVRDFIYWPILNVYGNVADVFLVVGVVLVGLEYRILRMKS